MSSMKGKSLSVEIFGESHSEEIGARVSGMPKTKVDFSALNEFLSRRRASGGVFSTARKESDLPVFAGVNDDVVEGAYSFYIKNSNVRSGDYSELIGKPRPSHADYAWYLKDGATDFRGGGRFSGRMTAPLCVVGGICKQYLSGKGIRIEAYVSQTAGVCGQSYKQKILTADEIVEKRNGAYPSLSDKEDMLKAIAAAKAEGDSVGGVIECVVYGLSGGIGNDLFEGLEGKISSLVFAVPAVKGVEFGLGFGLAEKRGSEVNDGLYYDENEKIKFLSNNSGGINGGISNGAPITISVSVRPTPSINKSQRTIDLINKQNCEISVRGRHDACIVPRAVPCIESAVAIALTDELANIESV